MAISRAISHSPASGPGFRRLPGHPILARSFLKIGKLSLGLRITGVDAKSGIRRSKSKKEIENENKLNISGADGRHPVPSDLWTNAQPGSNVRNANWPSVRPQIGRHDGAPYCQPAGVRRASKICVWQSRF